MSMSAPTLAAPLRTDLVDVDSTLNDNLQLFAKPMTLAKNS
jgi:hypothetical protein